MTNWFFSRFKLKKVISRCSGCEIKKFPSINLSCIRLNDSCLHYVQFQWSSDQCYQTKINIFTSTCQQLPAVKDAFLTFLNAAAGNFYTSVSWLHASLFNAARELRALCTRCKYNFHQILLLYHALTQQTTTWTGGRLGAKKCQQ